MTRTSASRRGSAAEAREIVFTSGGTEANNLALKGAAWAGKARGHRIVTSAVEHHAVGHTLRYLEKFGFEIVELPVDRYGRVDPDELEAAHDGPDDPRLDHARQQRGRARSSRSRRSPSGSGRARASSCTWTRSRRRRGSTSTSRTLGADLVSLGAHKFEGPKGVGALFVRHGTHILAQQHGGSQERHRRAGTENVAGAVGFATAYELSCAERPITVGAGPARARAPDRRRARGRGHRADRPSDRPAARPAVDHRPRHGRQRGRRRARPRGDRRLGRIGVHDRLDRGQPRPDRDGLPGRRGARGPAPVARAGRRPTTTSTTAVEVVPRILASMRLGSAAIAADPLGQGAGKDAAAGVPA